MIMTRHLMPFLPVPLLAALFVLPLASLAADPPLPPLPPPPLPFTGAPVPAAQAPTREVLQRNIDSAKQELARLESGATQAPDDLPATLIRLGAAYEALPETAAQAQPLYDRAKQIWRNSPPAPTGGPGYFASTYIARNRPLARQLYLLAAELAVKAEHEHPGSGGNAAYNALKYLGRFARQDAADCPDADAVLAAYLADNVGRKADIRTIELLELRGQINLRMGKFDTAEAMFQEAVATYNDNRLNAPQWLRNLRGDEAVLYYHKGQIKEADRIVEELKLARNMTDTDLVVDLARAGETDQALDQARQNLEKAMMPPAPVPAAVPGSPPAAAPAQPDVVAIAIAKANIADLLHGQGKYAEAEGYYLEALNEPKTRSDPRATRLRDMWWIDLGQLYRAMGNYPRAISYLQGPCAMIEKGEQSDYPDVIACHSELAFLYAATGRQEESEALYRQLLDTVKKSAPDDKALASSYTLALADVLAAQKKNVEAESTYQSVVATWEASRNAVQLREALTHLQAFYKATGDARQGAAVAKRIAALPVR